jgi:sulfite exporter TauE/SafE
MLGSITPLGERGRRRRWSATVAHYVLGSVLGGAVIGALAGGIGAALAGLGLRVSGLGVLLVLGVLCLAGILADLHVGGLRLPTISRQVNEDWLARYRSWVIGIGFGFQLGFAVLTIVATATVYVMLAAALLAGSLPAGIAIGATFGLARALPLLAARRVDTAPKLRDQHLRLARWAPRARAGAVAVQAATVLGVAVVLAVIATTAGGIAT